MYHQEHGRAPAIKVGEDGDEDGADGGACPGEARPHDAPHVALANLSNVEIERKENTLTKLNSVTIEALRLTGLNWLSQKRMSTVSSVAPQSWMAEGSSK